MVPNVGTMGYGPNVATFSWTYSPPHTTSGQTILSYDSATDGPYAPATSMTWSQWITPSIVGTVLVTVNKANNRTVSTTVYHTDFETNGSRQLLTRTDTNAASTVTKVVGTSTVYAGIILQ